MVRTLEYIVPAQIHSLTIQLESKSETLYKIGLWKELELGQGQGRESAAGLPIEDQNPEGRGQVR